MKKTVYILIFVAILLGLIGPLALSGITSDRSQKSSLLEQKAMQVAGSLDNPMGNHVKKGSGQISAFGGSAQEQSQTNISREKDNAQVCPPSGGIGFDKGVDETNSDSPKDSPDKNDTQKNARPGSREMADKNEDDNKNTATVYEKNERKDGTSPNDGAAEPEKGTEVSLAIVGASGQIIFGPGKVIIKDDNKWGATALGALEASGVEYKISSRFAGFVESIAGETNEGMKGWMYKVNDQVPMTAAGDMKLAAGDRVLWWYSEGLDKAPPEWDELQKTP